MASAISALPSMANRGWLRIDSKPVKQALATWVNKWQFRYTSYLHDSVTGALGLSYDGSSLYSSWCGDADCNAALKLLTALPQEHHP